MRRAMSLLLLSCLAPLSAAAELDGRAQALVDDPEAFRAVALPLLHKFIFSQYDKFGASELTFRHLKTHLSEQLGIPYEMLKRDDLSEVRRAIRPPSHGRMPQLSPPAVDARAGGRGRHRRDRQQLQHGRRAAARLHAACGRARRVVAGGAALQNIGSDPSREWAWTRHGCSDSTP